MEKNCTQAVFSGWRARGNYTIGQVRAGWAPWGAWGNFLNVPDFPGEGGQAASLQHALNVATTIPEVCRIFEAAVAPLGYASLDYASGPIVRWPMRDNLDWQPDIIYATHDWADVYFATHFQKHDRILPHMLRQVGPWLYWDVWSQPTDDPIARELDRMAQGRVKSGLSIPFHGPGLRFAGVNLGSALSRQALEARDRKTRATVFLMASQLHARIQALAGVAHGEPRLSAREVECLGWLARGKTAWETGQILAVSESAVKKHLFSASAKLHAQTGAHAVAIALSRGLIAL